MKDLRPGHHYAVIKAESSERYEKGRGCKIGGDKTKHTLKSDDDLFSRLSIFTKYDLMVHGQGPSYVFRLISSHSG